MWLLGNFISSYFQVKVEIIEVCLKTLIDEDKENMFIDCRNLKSTWNSIETGGGDKLGVAGPSEGRVIVMSRQFSCIDLDCFGLWISLLMCHVFGPLNNRWFQ